MLRIILGTHQNPTLVLVLLYPFKYPFARVSAAWLAGFWTGRVPVGVAVNGKHNLIHSNSDLLSHPQRRLKHKRAKLTLWRSIALGHLGE